MCVSCCCCCRFFSTFSWCSYVHYRSHSSLCNSSTLTIIYNTMTINYNWMVFLCAFAWTAIAVIVVIAIAHKFVIYIQISIRMMTIDLISQILTTLQPNTKKSSIKWKIYQNKTKTIDSRRSKHQKNGEFRIAV